jgi:hypothetical protein
MKACAPPFNPAGDQDDPGLAFSIAAECLAAPRKALEGRLIKSNPLLNAEVAAAFVTALVVPGFAVGCGSVFLNDGIAVLTAVFTTAFVVGFGFTTFLTAVVTFLAVDLTFLTAFLAVDLTFLTSFLNTLSPSFESIWHKNQSGIAETGLYACTA